MSNDNSATFGNHVRGLDGDAVNPSTLGNPSRSAVDHSLATAFVNNRVAPNTQYADNIANPSAPPAPVSAGQVDFAGAYENGRAMIHSELTPKSVIKVDGMQTTIAVAERMGLVRRGPHGYEAVGAAQSPQQQQQQTTQPQRQPQQQPQGVARGPEDRPSAAQQSTTDEVPVANFSQDVTDAIGESFDKAPAAASSIANAVVNNADFDPTSSHHVNELAARLGVEPSVAAGRVQETIAAFEAQAMRSVAAQLGGDQELASEAMQWARENRMEDLKRAGAAFWKTGRPDYRGVVQDYVAHLDTIDPAAVVAMPTPQGVRVFKQGSTIVVAMPDGTQVGWRTAIKQGWIKVTK